MTRPTRVLAFSGSLRQASFNTAALKVAMSLAPAACEIELAEIGKLPLYNQELDGDEKPDSVVVLTQKALAADAFLFATPEYNYSVPGTLKNAIDWLSRQKPQPFAGKAAAIMSASMSVLGGVRAHYHLRQIMVYLDVHFVNRPEIMIASAQTKFDEAGNLNDASAKELIARQLQALIDLSEQLRKWGSR